MSKPTARTRARCAHRRHARRVLGCVTICAVCLVAIPAESAVVSEIHERALISKIDVQADLKQQAQDDAEPRLLHQAELRHQAQAKAKAHADVAARSANAEEEAKQLDATRANSAAPAPVAGQTFNVVMGADSREALQSQVYASPAPIDASALYGSPWIVWDRSQGGLTFPQNAGATVQLTGTMTGTYRVDGVLQYIDATTPINEIDRGKDLTFQVCDPIQGRNRMHVVGLTRVA